MATGASNADLAIVLVDARKGLLTADPSPFDHRLAARRAPRRARGQQDRPRRLSTRRSFARSSSSYRKFAEPLGFTHRCSRIPISARYGDNVSSNSAAHALVRGTASARLSRARRGRRRPARRALPPPRAVGQPSASRLSRLRRHDPERTHREGRVGRRRRLRAAAARSRASSSPTARSRARKPATR